MTTKYRFWVPGLPVAKGRARSRVVARPGARPMAMHYTPKETRNFEAQVKDLASQAQLGTYAPGTRPEDIAPLRCPMVLELQFRFPIPPSWPKWKAEAALAGVLAHTGKPDCSNLAKAIEDACNGVLWQDDGQVVSTLVQKFYATAAGVFVVAYPRAGIPGDSKRADAELWAGYAPQAFQPFVLGRQGQVAL